jgi:hypothetical protein
MTIYHTHHIIPKHAGGTDDPSNLVQLTVEEHAEAHRRLYEEYGRWQDKLAWQGLAGMVGREEIIKEIQRENGRKVGRLSSKPTLGTKRSEETKKKISQAHIGRKQSQETKDKRAASHRGRKNSPETIERMRIAARERVKRQRSM